MWIILQIFGILLIISSKVVAELTGDHICETEESFAYNVTEYYPTNITIRNYKWCMGFPPRCSFYTFKTVMRERIVERNGTKLAQKCCPGFKENNNRDGCVSLCDKCVEGLCDYGKCICRSGFTGQDCSIACEQGRWGPDCKHECSCGSQSCDRHDGKCKCPEGFQGTSCDRKCDDGHYGENCEGRCLCLEDEICDFRTGECTRKYVTITETTKDTRSIHYKLDMDLSSTLGVTQSTNAPKLQKYHTFDEDITEWIPIATPTPKIINITFVNNGQFTTKFNDTVDIFNVPKIPSTTINSNDLSVPTTNVLENPVTTETQSTESLEKKLEETDGNDISEAEEMDYTMSDTVPMGSHVSIIVFITVVVFLVMVSMMIFYHNKAKIRRKIRDVHFSKNGATTPSVSVYIRSIFHTPLPDLPKFENPTFAPNHEVERTIETHVVCSLNFPNQNIIKEEGEFTYDHPPSTGSYKAASIPEPPEIPSEPVYDEIPTNGLSSFSPPPSYKSSCIYMNTCAKTRL